MAERTKATVLKTVVLRTPVNESLDLKEAPSNEGAFLVSATPTSSRQVANTGWVQAWAPVDAETVARK